MSLKQRFHRLRFFVADALDEWRHNPGINLLAVTTLASTLFLAGLLILVVSNLERRVEQLRDDVRVEVFLRDDASSETRDQLRQRLERMAGVARVEYVDKAAALVRYRSWAGEMVELIEELETNPLPASFDVFLTAGPEVEQTGGTIIGALGAQPGIEEVRFNRDWLRRLESMLDLARIGGTGMALLVFGAVVFVMASVVRLAVYSRQDEIDIMLLVGASPGFVRGPFLVAGLWQGLISSVLALALVEGVRRGALQRAGKGTLALIDLVASQPIPPALAGALILLGLVVSLAGSWFAVRRSF